MSALLEAGRIAPPTEHFELGDWIRYHHRAAVARLPEKETLPAMGSGIFASGSSELARYWDIVNKEGGRPEGSPGHMFGAALWLEKMPRTGRINKTIVVWPAEGEGVVFALIRRGIGRSVRGYESGYEYPEWNPGWFEADEWHWLYAVKTTLSGLNVIYVPLWAAQKVEVA